MFIVKVLQGFNKLIPFVLADEMKESFHFFLTEGERISLMIIIILPIHTSLGRRFVGSPWNWVVSKSSAGVFTWVQSVPGHHPSLFRKR